MPNDMTPIAELIAQFLYTKSSDEVLKSWNETASIVTNLGLSSVDLIKDFAEKGAEEAYAEGLRLWEEKHQSMLASSGSANMDYYKEVETKMLKNLDDANIKYKNLSSFIKGSAAAVNVGMNAFFMYAILANEISEAEQFHIEAVKEYLKHYEDFENLYVEEKIVNTIEEKAQLYDQQEKNIFKNEELFNEIGKSVGNTLTSIGIGEGIDIAANQLAKKGLVSKAALKNFSTTLIQLQFVSIGWDVVEMAIKENMGGALEASTALQASLYAMLLQNDAAMIRNQCTDFSNLDEYRKLEWMRLRSFYITRQLVLGFYEPQKLLHPEVYEIGMEPIKQDCEELVALMNVLESGPVGATQEVLDACATMRKEKDAELLNKVEEIVNGMVEKVVIYESNGDINCYYTNEYDSRGNRVKRICYDSDGSIGWYGINEYDSWGNQVKEINYKSDGSIDDYYTYEYTYRTFSLEKTVHIPTGAVEYNGHSYYVFSDICKSWEEAKLYCESLGGHLAVINNVKENKRVYEIMKEFGYSNAYFGFSDAEAEGKWKWVTEDTVTYTNWSSGEPNNKSKKEDYAMFYYKSPKYKWNDSNFGKGKKNNYPAFICEWDTTVDEKE